MDSLANADDLAAVLLQPLSNEQAQLASELLSRASALLRGAAPHTDARIADGSLDPVLAATVVAGMVKRVWVNPTGATSVTVGPYGSSYGQQAAAQSDLQVLPSDLAKLAPYQPTSRIGSIKLGAALAPRAGLAADGTLVQYGLRGYGPDSDSVL